MLQRTSSQCQLDQLRTELDQTGGTSIHQGINQNKIIQLSLLSLYTVCTNIKGLLPFWCKTRKNSKINKHTYNIKKEEGK